MEKYFTKEVKIAISVIISAVILYVGIEFLKGVNLMHPSNYYYIRYENVTGLTISTPINVDGFKVGLVRDIQYDYANSHGVVVEVSLDKKLKVPEGSKVLLTSDLLGTVTLNLVLNQYVSELHHPGDFLVGEIDNGLMGEVQKDLLPSITELMPKIDSILTGLNAIVQSQELQTSLSNITKVSTDLKQASANLSGLMADDVPAIVNDVKQITGNVNHLTTELKEVGIRRTIKHIDEVVLSVNMLMARLQSPDNTVGALLTDKTLYNSLNTTVLDADSLLLDLRLHPKRYVHFSVFGGKK